MRLRLPDPMIGDDLKGFPVALRGLLLSQTAMAGALLSEFETPVMTIDRARVAHNETRLIGWASDRGILVAPHGKTTMAPALWESALASGAHAITFATPWQLRAGLAAGVTRAMLANNLVDPVAIRGLASTLREHPHVDVWVWADTEGAVDMLARGLGEEPHARPLDVLVDVGAVGGRTGARSVAEAIAVAERIRSHKALRLRGVAGYEGAVAGDRDPESEAAVRDYLDVLAEVFARLHECGAFSRRPIVTAGGSAFPDLVVERLGSLQTVADVIIRPGAFQVHDSGLYARISPFRGGIVSDPLEPAAHVWARVISAPEPGLMLLDAGRRDLPVDTDLPVVERVLGRAEPLPRRLDVVRVNDQHSFVRAGGATSLHLGDVVRLGLSHPCTAFDKWKAVVEISGADDPDPRVTGAVATLF